MRQTKGNLGAFKTIMWLSVLFAQSKPQQPNPGSPSQESASKRLSRAVTGRRNGLTIHTYAAQ